ncbi:MAG: hypothetical protein KIH69_000020 [Anaerolineae bacterium]|nr:hypothetical protein [Anaerolineae bacterium]
MSAPKSTSHGLMFDVAVFASNLGLSFFNLNYWLKQQDNAVIGALALVAVLAQALGAYFVQFRWRGPQPGAAPTRRGEMWLLLLLHLILFWLTGGLGLLALQGFDSSSENWVWQAGLLAGITTWRVWATAHSSKPSPERVRRFWWLEYAGDALLWLSVTLVTALIWGRVPDLLESQIGAGLSLRTIVLLILLLVLCVTFYLPSRYLYLIEDRHSFRLWLRIFAAMSPLIRMLF